MEQCATEEGEKIGVGCGAPEGFVDVAAEPTTPGPSTSWLDGGHQPDSGGPCDGEEETSESITEEDNHPREEENAMLGKYFSKQSKPRISYVCYE